MNDDPVLRSRTAADLRRDFDQSFAEVAKPPRGQAEDFLAIGLCADPHALRLIDIVGVQPLGSITRFPSPVSDLCGVIGYRGAVIPVYDLRVLLGYAPPQPPRWVVVAAASPVALAFDSLDGHLRLERSARSRMADANDPRRHVREVLQASDGACPIVSIASVLDAILTAVQLANT